MIIAYLPDRPWVCYNTPMSRIVFSCVLALAASAVAQVKELGSGREVLWDMDRIASSAAARR